MFKIFLSRDILNDNPRKITSVNIIHGCYCDSSPYCDCKSKCKYSKNFRFHNFSVRVHDFFRIYLHIDLPHFLYVRKHGVDLSGTTKCPYNKSRCYTCWDCKYSGVFRDCKNPEHISKTYDETRFVDPEWGAGCRCRFFTKESQADYWDKSTGERIRK